MTLFGILVVLVVAGVALYLFNTFVTAIDPRFKKAINAIAGLVLFLVVLVWLLQWFGIDVGGPWGARPLYRRC